MDDALGRIEERLQRVERAIATLDRRIAALERGEPIGADAEGATRSEPVAAPAAPAATSELSDLTVLLSLVGRTFMVFGGAFLLRALTHAGVLPRGSGIAAGLAYALFWLAAADRAAGRERRLSGIFHGTAALAIGFPLLWEASTRFGFLSPPASAAALAALAGLALAVAWHRELQVLAALAMLGGIVAALGLARVTGQFVPFTVLLTLIGVATLWLAYDRDWYWLRWPPALVADAMLAVLAIHQLRGGSVEPLAAVIGTHLFLLAAYLGSFAARTLVRQRVVIPFEVLQTCAVLVVGLGGAIAEAASGGTRESQIGIASLVLGAGAYTAALARWRSRPALVANFHFYAALGLVLTATACAVLLRSAALAVVSSGLAVLTAWCAHRFSQSALLIHSAAYGAVAAGASGLLSVAATALVSTPSGFPGTLGASAWITLAAIAMCLAIPGRDAMGATATAAAVPRFFLGLLLFVGCSGVVIATLAPTFAGMPPAPGVLATVRTAVLAAGAVLLACAARYPRTAALGWLLYPVLGAIGCKLLVEDFRYSEPATLFLALGIFGAVLVASARLVKRGAQREGAPGSKPEDG
jgi:hypothetical protein